MFRITKVIANFSVFSRQMYIQEIKTKNVGYPMSAKLSLVPVTVSKWYLIVVGVNDIDSLRMAIGKKMLLHNKENLCIQNPYVQHFVIIRLEVFFKQCLF